MGSVVLLTHVDAARAANRLFVRERDRDGRGIFQSFTDADGTFTVQQGNGGLDVTFRSRVSLDIVQFVFVALGGGPPAPGIHLDVRSIDNVGRSGAIRFRAGDAACTGAPDGTACDDGDPCTLNDTCTNGSCQGSADDCDDSDPCTVDACTTAGGCSHDPFPGCWTVAGRAIVRYAANGVVQGRHVRCAARCRFDRVGVSPLLFDSQRQFRIPGRGALQCSTGNEVLIPDQVGTVRAGRHGRLVLTTINLDAIEAATLACQGTAVSIRSDRTVLRRLDANVFEGVETVRLRIPAIIPVRVTQVARVRATLRTAAAPSVPDLPPGARRLRVCSPDLAIHCTVN